MRKLLLNSLLLGLQAWLLMQNDKYLYVWETLTLLAMLLVNLRGILFVADRFYQAFILKRRHNSSC